MRKRLVTLSAVCLALLVPASVALAAGIPPAVSDCYEHGGQLTHQYSAAQLRDGLAHMPAEIKEYSPCYDTLQRALLDQIHGLRGGSSGGGGPFLPIPLIVVLALLVAGAAGFGVVALRNRGQ